MKLTGPLKIHGGKHDLAKWIISLMSPRCLNPNKPDPADPGWLHYVEPYFGGGAVLLANDPEGISEVVNDLNGLLMNFWRTLQTPQSFAAFVHKAQTIPFCEWAYHQAVEKLSTPCDRPDTICEACALAFFVVCRQSLAGRMDAFASVTKNRTRRGMNEQVSAWLNSIEGLAAVHARLKRVLIVGPDGAMVVIRKQDGPRTLFYLDPPYLHETRATTGEYQHEMSEADHIELLATLQNIKGRFLLSGYRSELYDEEAALGKWHRHEKQINNHAAGGKTKRVMTEVIWTNY